MENFYRNSMRPSASGEDRKESGKSMLWWLLGINVVAFLLFSNNISGLVASQSSLTSFQFYQLVTAGFLHSEFFHLFFNMWGLFLFGKLVAPHLGAVRLLILYLVGAVTGNLLFILLNISNPGHYVLGASGAICAIMAAAATLEPDRQFLMIFMPFTPMRTPTLVISYTVLEILLQLTGADSGVAHLAHLGGFLGGYLMLKILYGSKLPWDPLRRRSNHASSKSTLHWNHASGNSPQSAPSEVVSPRELDALLDKISQEGINSLSEPELARLRLARAQMRGNSGR